MPKKAIYCRSTGPVAAMLRGLCETRSRRSPIGRYEMSQREHPHPQPPPMPQPIPPQPELPDDDDDDDEEDDDEEEEEEEDDDGIQASSNDC